MLDDLPPWDPFFSLEYEVFFFFSLAPHMSKKNALSHNMWSKQEKLKENVETKNTKLFWNTQAHNEEYIWAFYVQDTVQNTIDITVSTSFSFSSTTARFNLLSSHVRASSNSASTLDPV